MVYAHWERPLQDAFGNLLAGQVRQIRVRRENTGTLARLFSDRDGNSPMANPFTVTNGKIDFYTAGGAYRITPIGYESDELRYVGIGTAQEQDANTFNSQGWQYQVETETVAPPTAGCVRFNNADLSLVTEIYVSSESLNGSDAESNLLGLDPGSKTVKNRVAFADQGSGVVMSYDVDSATDSGDYVTLAVSDHDGSSTYSGAALFLQREMSGRNGFDQDDARNFETATEAALYNPASAPAFTRTAGYGGAGDGGGALYKLAVSEPSHDGKYQDAAGNWYEIADFELSAKQFGAVADAGAGDTDDTAAIQALIDTRGVNGVIVIPPGRYYVPSNVMIYDIANGPNEGGLRIEATGVVLAGGGDIIIDSCKRVTIVGLDAPVSDLRFRGAWHCVLKDCRFQRLIVGDVDGTNFSSFAWNRVEGGYYQALIFSSAMSSYANHNTIRSAQFTGAAGQGFTGTANYAVEVLTAGTVQNLVFEDCDLSYYNTGIYTPGSGSDDLELRFIRCYFDSQLPKPLYSVKRLVETVGCHIAGKFRYLEAYTLSAQMRAGAQEDALAYSFGWAPYAGENLLPNGDLALKQTTYVGRDDSPLQSSGGATVSEGSDNGRYLRIQQTTAVSVRWRVPVTPVLAPYAATFIMRGHSAGQTLTIGLNGSQFFTVTVGTAWQVVQIGLNEEVAAGGTFDVTFSQASGANFDIDVRYADVHVGKAGGPIKLPQSASAKALTSYGLYTPTLTNTTNVSSSTAPSCAWSRNGDMVTVCGSVRITPTSAAGTETLLGMSLPVATDFSGSNECGGAGAPNSVTGAMFNEAWGIYASSANDTAVFIAAAQTNTDHSIAFSFTYRVM